MNTGAMGSPKIWVQYVNNKDCSQGFCSLYCPQWCYIIFPPPPPLADFPDESSGPSFSPLIITIIGILGGAFLLVSYYAIISKFCGRGFSSARNEGDHDADVELGGDNEAPVYEPWFVATSGLDEALIRSIAEFRYKRGGGLIEGTECSVCLSEFGEDESLRLLPKCSHAFHVECIDTWLKRHSNCPLCRADVALTGSSPPPPLGLDSPPLDGPPSRSRGEVGESATPAENPREGGDSRGRETCVEIGDGEGDQRIRRSASMDCICELRLSMADVLPLINRGEDWETEEISGGRNGRRREFEMNPVYVMKRSHSSGGWFLNTCGEALSSVIPL